MPTPEESIEAMRLENELLRGNLQLAYTRIQAGRSINEAANAQLIVQHLQASQMNLALHGKETLSKRKKGERFGGDGKGVVYTSTDMMEHKRKTEEEAQVKAADKKARTDLRTRIRVEKERIQREWEEICTLHTQQVSEWKDRVAQLKHDKIPRNQWPKAPIRPKKPTLPVELQKKTRRTAVVEGEQDQGGSVGESDDESNTDGD